MTYPATCLPVASSGQPATCLRKPPAASIGSEAWTSCGLADEPTAPASVVAAAAVLVLALVVLVNWLLG